MTLLYGGILFIAAIVYWAIKIDDAAKKQTQDDYLTVMAYKDFRRRPQELVNLLRDSIQKITPSTSSWHLKYILLHNPKIENLIAKIEKRGVTKEVTRELLKQVEADKERCTHYLERVDNIFTQYKRKLKDRKVKSMTVQAKRDHPEWFAK